MNFQKGQPVHAIGVYLLSVATVLLVAAYATPVLFPDWVYVFFVAAFLTIMGRFFAFCGLVVQLVALPGAFMSLKTEAWVSPTFIASLTCLSLGGLLFATGVTRFVDVIDGPVGAVVDALTISGVVLLLACVFFHSAREASGDAG